MRAPGKNNANLLYDLVTGLEKEMKHLTKQSEVAINAMNEIKSSQIEITNVIRENQPQNMRNIKKYVEAVEASVQDVAGYQTHIDNLTEILDAGNKALKELNNYYYNQYLVTVEKNRK